MILTADLYDYFLGEVHSACEGLKVQAQSSSKVYLADLLSSRAHTCTDESTLVQSLAEAEAADNRRERFDRFRVLGDRALYRLGFLAEQLEGRGLSESYLKAMGTRAYQSAALIARGDAQTYQRLATRFSVFALVLDEVKESTTMRTPQEIVRLYDRWKKTRSPRLAKRLCMEGVFPDEHDEGSVH